MAFRKLVNVSFHANFESETVLGENVSVYHSNVHFLVIVGVVNMPIIIKYNIIMVNKSVMLNIHVINPST